MKRTLSLSLAAILLAGANAKADTTTFDANLASPGNGAPGWYDGSANPFGGNPNGGFTVVTSTDGIELGLRAKVRQSPNVIHPTGALYTVPGGMQDASHGIWNYEFSIDLRPGGVGTMTFADITGASLTVLDVNTGATNTINPLTYFSDDDAFGGANLTMKHSPETLADWGAQNSENLAFSDFPLGAGYYQAHQFDTYRFTLSVTDAAGTATDSIDVQAAPLPRTAVVGMACLGIVGVGRFMKRKPVVA